MKTCTLLLLFFLIVSCREKAKEPENVDTETHAAPALPGSQYPLSFMEVLGAHGGLAQWRKQQVLRFEIAGREEKEVHTIDLYSRRDRIDTPDFSMGFNGEDVWLLDPGGHYEGDPIFYHNLMFYFYTMPFVLSDKGIRYKQIENLFYKGREYPGIGISYQEGVGNSPKDEYYLYYDPHTHRMAWLGYTVTYFSNAPSDDIHWIRYNKWQEVNGLLLPESISWYNYEGGAITNERNTVIFENTSLSEAPPTGTFFDLPEGATVVSPGT